jgi:serine/threonine protein kinase
VYRSNGQRVAIKASSKTLVHPASSQIFDNIESELEVHAKIQSTCQSSAITVRELFEDDQYLYVVMDLAEEGDLFNYVKNKHILQEDEVRDIYQQLLQAVDCLHHNGLAHLDLSLENVVICNGEFKLCDFGVAREIDCTGELLQHLDPSFRPGKPRYMSPEVVQGKFNGISADMFSLGVILFCLLYGFHPFESPADFDPAYISIMSNDFDSLLDMYHIRGEVSWEAEDLLSELLCQAEVRLPNCQIVSQHAWLNKHNI